VANISIDRLSVTLTGRSPGEGERLARLIGEKLATTSLSARATGRRESINMEIPGANGRDLDQLAEMVVEDLVRQLNRTT
jgi:hypothetical protein